MAVVTLDKLVKAYDKIQAVHGIDLEVADGEFIVLVGPSGCGKSTTLRMIAGLETVTDGEVRIDGMRVNDLQPGERDISMVFQNYALYPHLSVADNITFGLKLRKVPKAEIAKRLEIASEILGLEQLLNRKPRQLSGGQRQRVAMGRALIRNPSVFLFDEPLSNLDAKLRVQMRTEIKALHAKVPTTTIYVTHDQVEAMTLADRVVVMNNGMIEQIAPPEELYLYPETRFVAGFIGSPGMNFFTVRIETSGEDLMVRMIDGQLLLVPKKRRVLFRRLKGRSAILGIRPEHLSIGQGTSKLQVEAGLVEPLGMETLVHFEVGAESGVARVVPQSSLRTCTSLEFLVDMGKVHLLDAETDKVLG